MKTPLWHNIKCLYQVILDLFKNHFCVAKQVFAHHFLVSQIVIPSKKHLGGSLPFVFTETGVAMLSSVLNSKKAREMNIAIMRAFVSMRRMLIDNTELRLAIEDLRKKTDNHFKNIELAFQYLDELLEKKKNQNPEILSVIKFREKSCLNRSSLNDSLVWLYQFLEFILLKLATSHMSILSFAKINYQI